MNEWHYMAEELERQRLNDGVCVDAEIQVRDEIVRKFRLTEGEATSLLRAKGFAIDRGLGEYIGCNTVMEVTRLWAGVEIALVRFDIGECTAEHEGRYTETVVTLDGVRGRLEVRANGRSTLAFAKLARDDWPLWEQVANDFLREL